MTFLFSLHEQDNVEKNSDVTITSWCRSSCANPLSASISKSCHHPAHVSYSIISCAIPHMILQQVMWKIFPAVGALQLTSLARGGWICKVRPISSDFHPISPWSHTFLLQMNKQIICYLRKSISNCIHCIHIARILKRVFVLVLLCLWGMVASWLMCLSLDWVVWVQALARNSVLCSWARHFTLAVPVSTQVYKWVLANLTLGVTLQWTRIPSRGE